jgi:dienelactone hydrolase
MNTSRRSIWWWSSALVLALTIAGVAQPPPAKHNAPRELSPFLQDFKGSPGRELWPFLDEYYYAEREMPISEGSVEIPGFDGRVKVHWTRKTNRVLVLLERLPAVVMVYDQEAWTPWMQVNARELASLGYEVVTLDLQRRRLAAKTGASTDEATLADLFATVRWLRSRKDIVQNRIGVLGWGWSGGQALGFAAAMPVQACVICDTSLPREPGLIRGLGKTPLLAVVGGQWDEPSGMRDWFKLAHAACKWHVAAGQTAGFMGPPQNQAYNHAAAEDAWVAIYSFLEKYVEDGQTAAAPIAARTVATISDIMRAVNDPAGLRGTLSNALEQAPKTRREWQRIRANAALVAEAGGWLKSRQPPKGPAGHWQEQADAFTNAATALAEAADRRDYDAAKRGLSRISEQCAACHQEHR